MVEKNHAPDMCEHGGMTLRDYFAAQAVPSVISRCVPGERSEGENMEQMFARKAYLIADAMLERAAREQQERHRSRAIDDRSDWPKDGFINDTD